MDLVGLIIDFESGTLSVRKTLELFGDLVKTGRAWTLQGSYGRTARALINAGYLTETGEVTEKEIPE